MKVLVIGNGGREHALAWKLAQSPRVGAVFVAPGNGGTATEPKVTNVDVASTDLDALVEVARALDVTLTVVGPEAPLAAGVVDLFRARGLRVFGPTRAAARLESSKAFAKDFMQRHGIPTAAYATFEDTAAAHAHVEAQARRQPHVPIVVKADGLAAGKGVVVATTPAQAHEAIDGMLGPEAGGLEVAHHEGRARVVIEEFLDGEEASFIVLCDGAHVLPLATSQDHKRLLDGDLGPNTGGMGAYSPAPVVTPEVHARVMDEIIAPTLAGMARDGTPFSGFLYAGLMIDASGRPRTVEFNCRLGDPETQPILMRLRSDLFDVLMHAADGTLDGVELEWDRRVALGVVMAAAGYPRAPRSGDPIRGIGPEVPDAKVFHAGSALGEAGLVTAGGRVLCVTALGESVERSRQRVDGMLRGIAFDGAQYRHDIGHRAVAR